MYSTAEFRRGLKIEIDKKPYIIVEFQHVKPGKGGAFVRTKLRNLINGAVTEKTFRSGEKVDKPDLLEKEMQYLYRDDQGFYFMDMENYEQIFIEEDKVGDSADFLSDGLEITVLYHEGNPISLELPTFVELPIEKTDPGVRGDTATGGTKPATLSTGLVVQVPLFLNEGDLLKIDTRTGEYIERISK
ncbi:MAG: elongation factor P [Deltaproteobacteria bacterium]|uniref:Elongation factor P n=1 Tax=Candidatus Zymogenus saltonus TaxID=2844893 RepID=A0A9D8KFX4_9DELT|nr:elongation factor P [Candidatus Zymogenus saltonus]